MKNTAHEILKFFGAPIGWASATGPKPGKRKRRYRNKMARRERAHQAKQRNH